MHFRTGLLEKDKSIVEQPTEVDELDPNNFGGSKIVQIVYASHGPLHGHIHSDRHASTAPANTTLFSFSKTAPFVPVGVVTPTIKSALLLPILFSFAPKRRSTKRETASVLYPPRTERSSLPRLKPRAKT